MTQNSTQENELVRYFQRMKDERGIVQAHFARKIRISSSYFTRIIQGRRRPFTPSEREIIEAETGEPMPEVQA